MTEVLFANLPFVIVGALGQGRATPASAQRVSAAVRLRSRLGSSAVRVTATGWCTTTTRNCRAPAAVSRFATRSICAADTSPCLCRHARVVCPDALCRRGGIRKQPATD